MENFVDTPQWLYNSDKYKAGITEIVDTDIPDTPKISNLDELIAIIDICKEWRYNNEGRKYPIELYIYCYMNREEVLKLRKEAFPDIYEMMRGEGREPIEMFRPFIAMAILNDNKIQHQSIRWIDEIVPMEMNYSWEKEISWDDYAIHANFIFNIGLYTQNINFSFQFGEDIINYDWENLKDVLFNLDDNFGELVKLYKMLTIKKKSIEKSIPDDDFIDEYLDSSERIIDIRNKFKAQFRDQEFDFFVDIDELFSFNKMKEIVEGIKIPNILIYHFIKNFATFIRNIEEFK